MKIKKFENREDWLAFREGKISGSNAKDLKTKALSGYKKNDLVEFAKNHQLDEIRENWTIPRIESTLNELGLFVDFEEEFREKAMLEAMEVSLNDHVIEKIAAKVARPLDFADYVNPETGEVAKNFMDRGHFLEPLALRELSGKTGLNFKHSDDDEIWVSDFDEDVILSPDGYVDGEKITIAAEVKSLSAAKHLKIYYSREIPDEYVAQAKHYFIVNKDLEELHFVAFSDQFTGEASLIDIVKTREDFDDLEFLAKFYKKEAEFVRAESSKILEEDF